MPCRSCHFVTLSVTELRKTHQRGVMVDSHANALATTACVSKVCTILKTKEPATLLRGTRFFLYRVSFFLPHSRGVGAKGKIEGTKIASALLFTADGPYFLIST